MTNITKAYEAVNRFSAWARARTPMPSTRDPAYLETLPGLAWARAKVFHAVEKDAAEYIIVALVPTGDHDARTGLPLYRADWSETHDPQAFEAEMIEHMPGLDAVDAHLVCEAAARLRRVGVRLASTIDALRKG